MFFFIYLFFFGIDIQLLFNRIVSKEILSKWLREKYLKSDFSLVEENIVYNVYFPSACGLQLNLLL